MRTATILKGELNEFSSDSSGHSRCFLAWGGFSIPGAKKTLLTRLLSLLLSTASAAPILGLFNVKHGFGSRTSRRTACQSLTLHTGFHPANTLHKSRSAVEMNVLQMWVKPWQLNSLLSWTFEGKEIYKSSPAHGLMVYFNSMCMQGVSCWTPYQRCAYYKHVSRKRPTSPPQSPT